MATTPRGIRNNNPGNIRWGDSWKGLVPKEKRTDSAFCQFVSPEYGIRAMTRVLRNYTKYAGQPNVGNVRIDTVREIISRWAPPNENDTESYINSVSKALGVKANDPIDVFTKQVMLKLLKAIIAHENGQQPYSDAQITAGIDLA